MVERRSSPRTPISVRCTLRRAHGSVIEARTVDLGPGGMSVTTARPLSSDELLHFDLPLTPGEMLDGDARVLREQSYGVYALRFESLRDPARERLTSLYA